jgi:autotransporter-associated beta strand protein
MEIKGAGITPVITATPTWSTVDIIVGGGASGRLDHTAGTLSTGVGNWYLLGFGGATATYNLANTAGTGGTYTGFGQGSGSLNVAGNWLVALDGGTTSNININTSGTVTVGSGVFLGTTGATNTTFNLDSGAVSIAGQLQVGGDFYGQGAGTNVLNMSGGSISADIVTIARGSNNAAVMNSTVNVTGGTLSSGRYFTLGFAGSATNTATVNNSGGTVNVNTANGGGHLEMAVFDPTTNTFNQNSGNVNLQNNASILYGAGGNHSGTSTFNHNGGNVTFYSDSGATVGGTGVINLGERADTGTYVYNLNGGVLTTNGVTKTAAAGTGTFNFDGGTLRAGSASATFMTGLTGAVVKDGGAVIDSNGFSITIGQALTDGGGNGGLTKLGAGTLTLTGANTFTGDITIAGGTLSIGSAFINDAANVSMVTGSIFGLNFAGQDTIASLSINGAPQLIGTYGGVGSGANFELSYFTGTGLLNVTVSAIPEPSSLALLAGCASLGLVATRRRRRG